MLLVGGSVSLDKRFLIALHVCFLISSHIHQAELPSIHKSEVVCALHPPLPPPPPLTQHPPSMPITHNRCRCCNASGLMLDSSVRRSRSPALSSFLPNVHCRCDTPPLLARCIGSHWHS